MFPLFSVTWFWSSKTWASTNTNGYSSWISYILFRAYNRLWLVPTFLGIAGPTAWDFIVEFVEKILKLEHRFIKLPELADIPSLANGMCAFTDLKSAVGCLDGCYIPIRLPANADSQSYYCFKSFNSSLIVVLCDYKYCILGISIIGHPGNFSVSTFVLYLFI